MKVTSHFNRSVNQISSNDILLSIPTGKNQAVTANYIAIKLRCLGQNSQPHIRKIISNLIDAGYLIGSCQNGYFIIEKAREFKDYIESLEVRKTGIQKRINHLYDNWAMKDKNE